MTLSIQDLQKAFAGNSNEGQRDNNYYPIWKLKDGESVEIRFLPDKNPDNPKGFLVEKLTHRLVVNGEERAIPCLTMYGEDCPICAVSRAYYKKEDKANGKKYWRKKNHIAQALIVSDPLQGDGDNGDNYEGQVKLVSISYQIYTVLQEAFKSGELDAVPYDYEEGCNFIIKRSIKRTPEGDFGDYTVGTKFARKSSALDEEIIAYVEDRIVDLREALPEKPDLDGVEQTLQAALTGSSYSSQSNSGGNGAATQATAAVEETSAAAVEEEETGGGSVDERTQDLLARIRQRQSA